MAPTTKMRQRLPDIKAIAARAERARPKPARPSRQERAAETRRRAADEKRFRARALFTGRRSGRAAGASAREVGRAARRSGPPAGDCHVGAAGQMDRVAHASRVRAGADRGNGTVRDRHGAVHPRVAKRRGVARTRTSRPATTPASIRLDIDGDILDAADEARLSFYALWQNRQDVDVTVRVASQLNVNAHVSAHADGRRFSSIFIPGALGG